MYSINIPASDVLIELLKHFSFGIILINQLQFLVLAFTCFLLISIHILLLLNKSWPSKLSCMFYSNFAESLIPCHMTYKIMLIIVGMPLTMVMELKQV